MSNYQEFLNGINGGDLDKIKKYINKYNINLHLPPPDLPDTYPIHASFQTCNSEIVKYFLDLGAMLNVRGGSNFYSSNSTIEFMTHQAIDMLYHRGSVIPELEIIKLLYEYGAELNIKSEDGKTPLDIALDSSCIELQEFLRDLGAKTSKEIFD